MLIEENMEITVAPFSALKKYSFYEEW